MSLHKVGVSHQIKAFFIRRSMASQSLMLAAVLMAQTSLTAAQAPLNIAPKLIPESEQITPTIKAPLPEPDSLSGWLQIEVAVLIDTKDTTLTSEQWPLFPEPRYPAVGRWLKDPALLSEVAARYPDAAIAQNEEGAITVILPAPLVLSERPAFDLPSAEDDISGGALLENDSAAVELVDIEFAAVETLNSAEDVENNRPFAILFELVDAPEIDTQPGATWLDGFETLSTSIKVDTGSYDFTLQVDENIAMPPAPLPLPEAFRLRPVTLLADGLAALITSTGDRLQVAQAWVQPPGASNLPILFDRSGDDLVWPELQGFIELRRGGELRLGINFWLNTTGQYLPEGLLIAPPPRLSQRMTVIETASDLAGNSMISGTPETTDSTRDTAWLSTARFVQESDETESIHTPHPFNALPTNEEESDAGELQGVAITGPAVWHWKHLIQVADTRPVDENTIRYFDHPVIKVLATYRELTWSEVYALGTAEADEAALAAALREVDAVIETADNIPVKSPAGQVPPGTAPTH